jgi:TRAP-type C4-dicarboxylate transport system permease small subunit
LNATPLAVIGVLSALGVLLGLWAGQGAGAAARVRGAILALDRVTTAIAALAACTALAVAVAAGAWQVFSRFATETPATWSEALVRVSLIWMVLLGLAVTLRAGALVSIDVAHRYTRGAVRRTIEAMTLACALSLMGVLFWFGWAMAERVQFQTMAGLEISIAWGYAAIPIGAALAVVGALAHFLDRRSGELETAT